MTLVRDTTKPNQNWFRCELTDEEVIGVIHSHLVSRIPTLRQSDISRDPISREFIVRSVGADGNEVRSSLGANQLKSFFRTRVLSLNCEGGGIWFKRRFRKSFDPS